MVRESMNALIGEAAKEAGVARGEILEVTIVGNPIMHHLVLGLDPTELGGAPFALTIDGGYEVRARELGLDIAPGAFVYALPCIAGHVGADAAGVVLAEAPYEQRRAHAAGRRRHQRRDRLWRQARGCSPAPRRPARPSRARRFPAASAPRPGRSSACASTARRWSRASR